MGRTPPASAPGGGEYVDLELVGEAREVDEHASQGSGEDGRAEGAE